MVKLDSNDVRPLFTPMHCPDCAEEDGFIDVTWCIANVRVCTRHRKSGVDRCAACGTELSWDRPAINRCGCGQAIQSADRVAPLQDGIIACTELIQHLVHPRLRSPVTAKQLGFPVNDILRLDLKQVTRLLHDLAMLHWHAEGQDERDQRSDLERAAALLSDWPRPFETSLQRVTEKLPIVEALTYLFKRDGSILSRGRRCLGGVGGVFEFLTRPIFSFLDSSPLGLAVDNRIRTRLGTLRVTKWASITQASKATGLDPRALNQLVAKGIIHFRSIGPGRIAVDITEISRDVVKAWKTMGDREAAATIGLPVQTFKRCLEDGVLRIRLLQSALRGFSIAGVIQIRNQLNGAAARSRIVAKSGRPSFTLREIMRSSQFTTSTKVNLVAELLEGRLPVISRGKRGFLNLRIEEVAPRPRALRRRPAG